jgi:hypothetical protein
MSAAYVREVSSTKNRQTATEKLQNRTRSSSGATNSDLGKWMQIQQQKFEQAQDEFFASETAKSINSVNGWLASIRAAYRMIGKMPIISLSEQQIPINIPWILPQELDRYALAIAAYKREFDATMKSFCAQDMSASCLEKKARIQSWGFAASINQNLQRIEEYKNFPIKLQKYLTWKQRYTSQVLCNIDTIKQMFGWWIRDNGIRFRKYVEVYVLAKAIAESWQALLDIFITLDRTCAKCTNQRYNATDFKLKGLSMIIPSFPIIRFPRWPDIILDLSDVRFGIHIAVPNFQPRLNPIRLPNLPSLALPRSPNALIALPAIDVLPPIPALPDLPDLPSLPRLKLPNLPPPPKIPKVFGAVTSFLSIAKLISKMMCYYRNTTLIPEWNVWDVIAQRTERQWTLPIDFLNFRFPNLALPSLRSIRVSSHINLELKADFLVEFAKTAVKPINSFNTDLTRSIPKTIAPDVNIGNPVQNIRIKPELDGTIRTQSFHFETPSLDDSQDISDAIKYYRTQLMDLWNIDLLTRFDQMHAKNLALADAEIHELLEWNTQRFDAIEQTLWSYTTDTAILQKIIDVLTKKTPYQLVNTDIPLEPFVSSTEYVQGNSPIADYNQKYIASLDGVREASGIQAYASIMPDFQAINTSADTLRTLAMDTMTTSQISTSDGDISTGYAPRFQGIYTYTPSGEQIRLFDYLEPLRWDEQVDKIDIDKDGDQDFLFLFDGVIMIKYNHTTTPEKIHDSRIFIDEIASEDLPPTAPNYFHEQFSTPGKISLTFSPADSEKETGWRLDFYDRYNEWEVFDQGDHDEEKTPKKTIEFFKKDMNDTFISGQKIERSIDRFVLWSGSVVFWPRLSIVSGGDAFRLSAGRVVYTGNGGTVLSYTGSDNQWKKKVLWPNSRYQFEEPYDFTIVQGKLFIPSFGTNTRYGLLNDEYTGLPLIPWMQLFTGEWTLRLRDHNTESSINIGQQASYGIFELYPTSEGYAISLDYPNGFYSAALRGLNAWDTPTRVTLLAPQKSSDKSPPEIELPDRIRIPVYQTQDFLLRNTILETNAYTLLWDDDIRQDTDQNGVFDDDFRDIGSGMKITPSLLSFWPFPVVENRTIVLRAEDEFGNITEKPVTLEIYSPVPQISNISSWWIITGKINESLANEPVDIFRVRSWQQIVKITQSSLMTDIGGNFSFHTQIFRDETVIKTQSGNIVVWTGGKITSIAKGMNIQTLFATSSRPMSIDIVDASKNLLYTQLLKVPDGIAIVDMNSPWVQTSWEYLWVQTFFDFTFVRASERDPRIPWWVYVIDANFHPIFALAPDGNIYALTEDLSLQYVWDSEYIQLEIVYKWKKIAKILFHFQLFSAVK